MKKLIAQFLVLIVTIFLSQTVHAVTIHSIGDSTMANYDESSTDKRGWGMMFQQFFNSDVSINNRAKSGASSKSFYKEAGYWDTVKKQIASGDYVFIQFAHNDEKNNGLDGDSVKATTDPTADYRGTTAQGTYKTYLRVYINETRALGAEPVLVTPICRKYFSSGKITRKGRHDLGENFGLPESDRTHDYVFAMQEVAAEMNVALIDLTQLTKTFFESYGDQACTELLFCKDDSTHPNALGASMIARLCAQEMVRQDMLASSINASSDLLVNPGNHDFGKAYMNQQLTKEYSITGFDLTPATGSFTISASEGFSVSLQKIDPLTPSIELSYTNGNVDFTRFYVTATLGEPGIQNGTLTISNGTTTLSYNMTAECVELTGGTAVNLFWELTTNEDNVLTGPARPINESFSDMHVQRYASPNAAAVWPEGSGYDATRKTQRNLIVGDVWPAGDIDEVSTRYIQFGIAPNAGTELNIDSIGLYVCGAGGNGMRCRISYSTNGFTDYTVIQEFSSMVANNMYAVSAIPVLKLNEGDSLLVRVYPWYNGTSTGKTLCLSDLTIRGVAQTATGLEQVDNKIDYRVQDGIITLTGLPVDSQIQLYDVYGRLLINQLYHSGEKPVLKVPQRQLIYLLNIGGLQSTKTIKVYVP